MVAPLEFIVGVDDGGLPELGVRESELEQSYNLTRLILVLDVHPNPRADAQPNPKYSGFEPESERAPRKRDPRLWLARNRCRCRSRAPSRRRARAGLENGSSGSRLSAGLSHLCSS